MRISLQSPFQTLTKSNQPLRNTFYFNRYVLVHLFWIAENRPNIWSLLLLEIMPMTQFDFPEKYEYLAGFGLYHQYANHQIMNPTMGRSNTN